VTTLNAFAALLALTDGDVKSRDHGPYSWQLGLILRDDVRLVDVTVAIWTVPRQRYLHDFIDMGRDGPVALSSVLGPRTPSWSTRVCFECFGERRRLTLGRPLCLGQLML